MSSLHFPTGGFSRDRWRALRHVDGWLLIAAGVLLLIGLLSLFSLERSGQQGVFTRQLVRVALGAVPFGIFLLVDPQFWKRSAKVFYVLNLLLLGGVLAIGKSGGGAQRWLQLGPIEFQPSEVSKLLTVLTVAAFFAARESTVRNFSTFLLSLVHVAIPAFLVFKQPHLGGTLVLIVGWLSVCLAAGVPSRYLLGAIIFVVAGLGLAMKTPGVLRDYQKERVKALLAPNPEDNAYQVLRAEVAFGSGGVFGSGFLNGEQKSGGFIPEQDTDFIFTVVGEEGGFIGCLLVLATFGFFLVRIWVNLMQAENSYHRMIVGGVYGVLAFHIVVNLGSILQLLPVVGLWLPFMSAGGTALWLSMACVGLVANVRGREWRGLYG